MDDDLKLALALADAADEITMARFGAADLTVDTKADRSPVSEADTAVERMIRERLAGARPDDAILGEEYGSEDPSANGRRWIVDPIDGTQSYVRGVPVWATLIALERDGTPVVGVASAPALRRRWWATRGGGAHVRDPYGAERRLRVSAIADLGEAQVLFGGYEEWRRRGLAEGVPALASSAWRSRGYGDFWQYMLVAEGAAEVASDPEAFAWDLAVPRIVVTEAGGRLTDLTGAETHAGGSGLATNGSLHDEVRAILTAT